jgi:hypothetical protein
MPEPTLLNFPFVRVRIRCDLCNRSGGYRLARLAEKFGADFPLDQLLARLAHATCGHRPENQRKGKRWRDMNRCQAYFRDLEPPQPPPDLPLDRGLRVVEANGGFRKVAARAGLARFAPK